MILPGPTGYVRAGETVTLSVQSQLAIQPLFLFIPRSIASMFAVIDLRVGHRSLFPTAGSIPAELFAGLDAEQFSRMDMSTETRNLYLRGLQLDCDKLTPGHYLSLVVQNISAAIGFQFSFSLLCKPVEETFESLLDSFVDSSFANLPPKASGPRAQGPGAAGPSVPCPCGRAKSLGQPWCSSCSYEVEAARGGVS